MRSNSRVVWVAIPAFIFAILLVPDQAIHMPPVPPHIKNLIWICLAVCGVILLLILLQDNKPVASVKDDVTDKLKGRIREYRANRIGDIDKLIISTEDKNVMVHFPPHAAEAVMKAAPKNQMCEIKVRPSSKKTPTGAPVFDLVGVTSSTPVFTLSNLRALLPAAGKEIEASGKAGKYKLDEKGIVAGIILGNYLVDLPPTLVKNILPTIRDSVAISIKGYQRSSAEGFVNTTGLILVRPYAISIDQTDYIL